MGALPWGWILLLPFGIAVSQIRSFPYSERFDSAFIPALPPGWESTTNRLSSGDFFTTISSPRSSPAAVQSTNSTIPQALISPAFDFTDRVPNLLEFFIARSSTHISNLLVEASLDSGATWPLVCSDTLRNPGSTGYVQTVLRLPEILANESLCRFRWRILGGTGGTSGTLRMDDIVVSVFVSQDLTPGNLRFEPPVPSSSDAFLLKATLRQNGILESLPGEVRFFRDTNKDDIAETAELFSTVALQGLRPGDSADLVVSHSALPAGSHHFLAVSAFPSDEVSGNDTTAAILRISAVPQSLVINEILYQPLAGQNEWVEVLNRGTDPVNLFGWTLSDKPTAGGSVNTTAFAALAIEPNSFAVIAADSTILAFYRSLSTTGTFIANKPSGLGLSNEGDALVLKDLTGKTVDSVEYSPSWHHPLVADTRGRSLERIQPDHSGNDPRNWSTSAHPLGGTPGEPNTVLTRTGTGTTSLSFSPNPFSPDGDGREDFCAVRFVIPLSSSVIRIRIFDREGRLIRTLADGEPAGPEGSVIWDGMETSRRKAAVGPYIVLLEAAGSEGGVFTARGVIVVAARL